MPRHLYGHRHRARRRRFSELTDAERQQRTIWTTVASNTLSPLVAIVVLFVGQPPSIAVILTAAPQVVRTIDPLSELSAHVFDGLASKDPEVTLNTISGLHLLLGRQTDTHVRNVIFDRVASFVRLHAPAPHGGTYARCSLLVAPSLSAEVQAGLKLLLERSSPDLAQQLDLSDTNLAYVKLPNQQLDNIDFDGSLLCRAILTGATFSNSTFTNATLRYAVATKAVGLNVAGLLAAYSLCGARLPSPLQANTVLRQKESTDPEPYLRCNVA
jgi:hypothetical protein